MSADGYSRESQTKADTMFKVQKCVALTGKLPSGVRVGRVWETVGRYKAAGGRRACSAEPSAGFERQRSEGSMKRLILAALAATALATAASAYDLTVRFAPPLLFSPGSTAHIIDIPEPIGDAERNARDAAISRWVEHCQPVKHVDAYGVTRLSYRHPGCEFGEGE